ncbi:hypothetical protein ILUMI_10794 [Ignelater luminosus]|uniref:HTH CENPB-type domain-containing protein n=1 Tax=Ignelater luminosus TaxID=2038154 RepID=A0A8K0D1Q4_IGNLU|nr:hypothetical protein ILUMI_10794 [Ignelater luminosus]
MICSPKSPCENEVSLVNILEYDILSVSNFDISSQTTLTRYVKKCKDCKIDWDHASMEDVPRLNPYCDNRRIFSDQQETTLCDYLQTCAKLHHGLPPKAARSVAYELAATNNIEVPDSWSTNKMAGEEWLTAFLKRNKNISIRSAESTSISRAMGFNKPHNYIITVQSSIKVLATTGQKEVGQVTSTERGTLITMCGTINALGNSIPSVLIFPRVHYKDFVIKGAPHGTLGAASPSGWMSTEVFAKSWLFHHLGKRVTIYDIPEILGQVYSLAFSSSNIISAFQKTGLYPFNRYVFDDSEFLASSVIDIAPNETTATSLTSVITSTSLDAPSSVALTNNCYERAVTPPHQFIPPHVIHPYTNVKRNYDMRKVIENAKIAKKMKQSVKRNLSKPTKERKVDFSYTSSDFASVSELPEFGNSDNDMPIESEEAKTCEELKINGLVLVRFATKKQLKYYVGQLKEILQDELIVIFLRRKKDKFVYPAVENVVTADKDDIVPTCFS